MMVCRWVVTYQTMLAVEVVWPAIRRLLGAERFRHG